MGAPELSYEQARAELAGIVDRLEAGGTTLEESLALWERGEELAAVCQRWLDGARTRLDAARPAPEPGSGPGSGSASGPGSGSASGPGSGSAAGPGPAPGRGRNGARNGG